MTDQKRKNYYYFHSGESEKGERLCFCGTPEKHKGQHGDGLDGKWKVRVGIAKCNSEDNYDKRIGRKIAFDRLHDTMDEKDPNPDYTDEFFIQEFDYENEEDIGKAFARFCKAYCVHHNYEPDKNLKTARECRIRFCEMNPKKPSKKPEGFLF